jgi:hypothetical protein
MIIVDNGQKIELGKDEYRASGGQAKVFVYNHQVYKVMHDPDSLIPNEKINELSVLKDRSNVYRPLRVFYSVLGDRIGLVFNEAVGNSLVEFITNTYVRNHNLTPADMLMVTNSIIDTIKYIHKKGIIQVDGNPYNYIIGNETLFIDVDAWQTPSFKASAIMPIIADPKTKVKNEDSDIFSFGVVSFMIFSGIHPFRGEHPQYGENIQDLMRMGLPIFHKDIISPTNVRPFDKWIPRTYMGWYKSLFEKGIRCFPPDPGQGIYINLTFNASVDTIKGDFEIKLIKENLTPIKSHHYINGRHIFDFESKEKGQDILVGDNWFIFTGDQLRKMETIETTKGKRHLVVKQWGMVKTTKVWEGFLISDILGKIHFYLPQEGDGLYIVPVPELDGVMIRHARRDRNIVIVNMNTKDGQDVLCRFKFDSKYKQYEMKGYDADELTEANFTVLDGGIGVMIYKDGEMLLFESTYGKDKSKIVKNSGINRTMTLSRMGNKACFIIDNKLYSLTMK